MRATEHSTIAFDAVTNDPTPAMVAGRREFLNRAFKAVERMPIAVHDDLKRLVVRVATGFTGSHVSLSVVLVVGQAAVCTTVRSAFTGS